MSVMISLAGVASTLQPTAPDSAMQVAGWPGVVSERRHGVVEKGANNLFRESVPPVPDLRIALAFPYIALPLAETTRACH